MEQQDQQVKKTVYHTSVAALPSVYTADPVFGLLHLPRFLAKVRLHLQRALPSSYQRNFAEGFDALLCLHIGMEASEMIELAEECPDDDDFYRKLALIFPGEMNAHQWNRQLTQLGLTGEYKEKLDTLKEAIGIAHRSDIVNFADLIEYQEDRLNA